MLFEVQCAALLFFKEYNIPISLKQWSPTPGQPSREVKKL